MQSYTLACQLVTTVSVEEAFAVFENPYNLARITPPWLNFQILTEDLQMRSGAEIEYLFRWNGFPLHWKTRITEYDPPFLFVDEALRSPYKFWRHYHSFRKTDRGTAVSDVVHYAMPYGLLGRAVHALAVSKQLTNIFEFRQKAIAELLGGEITDLQAPAITLRKE